MFPGRNKLHILSNLSEIPDCHDCLNGLLVNVSGPLEEPCPDVVVGQGAPEVTNLVGVAAQAASKDGVHIEALDLVRVFGDEFAELVPERVVGLALLGHELLVVDQLGQPVGGSQGESLTQFYPVFSTI